MSNYRRLRIKGGTYFFTVNLQDRRSDLLVREINTLRRAVAQVRAEYPFDIDAWSFCRTTCIASGPCRLATMRFRSGGRRSR